MILDVTVLNECLGEVCCQLLQTLALFNLFAPEPPVTTRADPGPFYPL